MNTALKQQSRASESDEQPQLYPVKFFETMHAYQRTAALKAAIEFDLFTAIGDGEGTIFSQLAQLMKSAQRWHVRVSRMSVPSGSNPRRPGTSLSRSGDDHSSGNHNQIPLLPCGPGVGTAVVVTPQRL